MSRGTPQRFADATALSGEAVARAVHIAAPFAFLGEEREVPPKDKDKDKEDLVLPSEEAKEVLPSDEDTSWVRKGSEFEECSEVAGLYVCRSNVAGVFESRKGRIGYVLGAQGAVSCS